MDLEKALQDAAARAARYQESMATRQVPPSSEALAGLSYFEQSMPEHGIEPEAILDELERYGAPATMATTGGRFFGFMVGGLHPSALVAKVMVAGWDQNSGLNILSPVNAKLEDVANLWLVEALGLPEGTAVGFVSGATSANITALATARHVVLERAGWNVAEQGLFGAPEVTVIVGAESHLSISKALMMLGMGSKRVVTVPVDNQGRMRADLLPSISGPTIVCTQAGNLNTGAFDPVGEICEKVAGTGAWVHVDAAFGMWAAASPALRHLTVGMERADSWATDGHKWLNTPYDNGMVFVRDRSALMNTMAGDAAYLVQGKNREPWLFTPTMSERARGLEVWATLRALGRTGLAEMVERHCRQAQRFAQGLRDAGYEILNDVVINQVLVSFGTPEQTRAVIARIQQDGRCWCAGTVWQERTTMRISIASWATTDEDVEISLQAMLDAARAVIG